MRKKIFLLCLVTFLISILIISNVAISADVKAKDYKNIIQAPEKPTVTGPNSAKLGEECEYLITSTDPQDDYICYEIRCSDSPSAIIKSDYFESEETMIFGHCWCDFYQCTNPFTLKVRAIDNKGHESEWESYEVEITDLTYEPLTANTVLFNFLQNHPILYQIFSMVFNL